MKLFFALILLFSNIALADDFLEGALGIFNSGNVSAPSVKYAAGGMQDDLIGPFKDRWVFGLWTDSAGNGRQSSAFGTGQIGFEVNSGSGLLTSIFFGPALISTPDAYLGGYFQFTTDFHLGIVDFKNNSIGAFYRHISSAGLETPNTGRDFAGLEIRFPF